MWRLDPASADFEHLADLPLAAWRGLAASLCAIELALSDSSSSIARPRRAPPHPGIEVAITIGVFHRQRRLADPAQPLHRGAAEAGLGDRRRLVAADQDPVKPVEFGRSPGETGDTRRRADKRQRRRPRRLRLSFGSTEDAAAALLRIVDADE